MSLGEVEVVVLMVTKDNMRDQMSQWGKCSAGRGHNPFTMIWAAI